jgi:opacity protein-like surface antigen
MKKLFFLAVVMVIAMSADAQRRVYRQPVRRAPAPRYAQPRSNNYFRPGFGFKIGANFSNSVSTRDYGYTTGSLVGLNLGLFADLPIVQPISFAPEVLYSQKGYVVGTTYGNFTQRTHFIDVPLLAKFKVSPTFNILVGPQLSWLMSTTNTYDDGFVVTQRSTYDSDNNGHKTYLDGVVGVSFDINRNVDIHGRYNINLQKTDRYGNTYTPDYRNQVWQVGLGFKF